MNKMERPMMTVVRFGAEDVIATSVQLNHSYAALGSEINQSSFSVSSGTVDNVDKLYSVIFNNGNDMTVGGEADPNLTYVWYNNGWLTENKAAKEYDPNYRVD